MRQNRLFYIVLLIALLLTACQPRPVWQDVKSDVWWKDATFYEAFVRSFYDSNGDGNGDIAGLTAKLDYLNDGKPGATSLNVTGLWVMPIFPSPSYHGYDVTDYYNVNPQYGTLDDFKKLVQEAHKRNIHIIIDFVINHTSTQHPWFKASAAGDPQYKDWYIWSDKDPGYQGPWGEDVWHKSGDHYYYGIFDPSMPDLNYRDPAVTQEIYKIAAFWLKDVGIDGFRIDGAKHLVEDGQEQQNTPETHAWLNAFTKYVKTIKPDALVVGEILGPSDQVASYVNTGDVDLAFNVDLANDILAGATFKDARRISNSLSQQAQTFTSGIYAPILSNHDFTRVLTKTAGSMTAARAAAAVLLTAPGVPFIYYGEEIGMTGDKPDPNIRTPMQWTAGSNAGFSTGTPWHDINGDYKLRNVEDEAKDSGSLLSLYRQLTAIRANHYALRSGSYVQVMVKGSGQALAVLRTAEKESVLVLVNLSKEPLQNPTLKWDASSLKGTLKPSLLLGEGSPAALTVNDKGGVDAFQPLASIPGNGLEIIQFVP